MALGRLLQRTGHFERHDSFGNSRNSVIDLLLLAYVMRKEIEQDDAEAAAAFKNMLFAHALVNQNPEFFFKMYPQDFGMSEDEEAELEWQIPRTEAELHKMMAEFGVSAIR